MRFFSVYIYIKFHILRRFTYNDFNVQQLDAKRIQSNSLDCPNSKMLTIWGQINSKFDYILITKS